MRTIFLVLAAFLLTWMPMLVLALLDMIHSLGGLGSWKPPAWLYVFAMWSMCAGSVTYPILYGIYNRAIRKELRLCLSCSSGGSHAKGWRSVHQFYGPEGGARGQRRGSKWSTYSGPKVFFFIICPINSYINREKLTWLPEQMSLRRQFTKQFEV